MGYKAISHSVPPALLVGPMASRTSSLTHVAPPGNPPVGSLTYAYPDFLRKRTTPARHDVVAEEVDKELLVRARDTDGMGRELSGLTAEIRDFLKNNDGPGSKEETWARLAEMAGFPLSGFGFFSTRLGMGPIIGSERQPFYANSIPIRMRCGAAAYASPSGIA